MIFQEPMTSLNPVYTVGQQIAETIRLHEELSRRAGDGPGDRDAAPGAYPDAGAARRTTIRTSSPAACASG